MPYEHDNAPDIAETIGVLPTADAVERAEAIGTAFAAAPAPTDHPAMREYVRTLTGLGLHVLFINPGTKSPPTFAARASAATEPGLQVGQTRQRLLRRERTQERRGVPGDRRHGHAEPPLHHLRPAARPGL